MPGWSGQFWANSSPLFELKLLFQYIIIIIFVVVVIYVQYFCSEKCYFYTKWSFFCMLPAPWSSVQYLASQVIGMTPPYSPVDRLINFQHTCFIRMCKWLTYYVRFFNQGKFHQFGGWMGTRTSVDAVVERLFTVLARNQNPGSILSLYRLHYPSLPNDQTTFTSHKPLTILIELPVFISYSSSVVQSIFNHYTG
jgi:hypothetical protein